MVSQTLENLMDKSPRSQSMVSGKCDIHGTFEVRAIYFFDELKNSNPLCCQCEKARIEQVHKKKERQEKYRLLDASGVPPKFRYAEIKSPRRELKTATSVVEECLNYVSHWPTFREAGEGRLFIGRVGAGKTYLACAMAREIIDRYLQQPIYITAAGLLQDLRRAYDRESGYSEYGVLKRYSEVPLLILDELGAKIYTENEKATLTEVVDRRYGGLKPTISISNLPVGELGNLIGERFVDRLKDQSPMLVLDWDSLRGRSS